MSNKKKPVTGEKVMDRIKTETARSSSPAPEADEPEIETGTAAAEQEARPGPEADRAPEAPPEPAPAPEPAADDRFLRLAAEYDNYRKRTAKEKESIWSDATAQTVAAFLPVYDNLERALKQPSADPAYAKGVEMTMKGLQDALTGLGVELIPALGESFDPKYHNAVMHVDDPDAGENTVVEVFQQGFTCGEKVIRFAMVKVAN